MLRLFVRKHIVCCFVTLFLNLPGYKQVTSVDDYCWLLLLAFRPSVLLRLVPRTKHSHTGIRPATIPSESHALSWSLLVHKSIHPRHVPYVNTKIVQWVFICGNKMPTRCNRCYLLQILLLAQHVSGTIMPIIRSSRVLYRWSLPVYNTLELLMMGIMMPETYWASNKICNKYHLLHLVGILFPYINDDSRSKSLQIYVSIHITISVRPSE